MAVAQAESSLRSAQTSYDRTVAGAGDAQRSLDQAQQSTQTDIANAQQAVTKLKTNYASARNTAGIFAPRTPNDARTRTGNGIPYLVPA